MTTTPTLYRIRPAAQRDVLDVEQVWTQDGTGPLLGDAGHVVALTVEGTPYLLETDAATGKGSAYRLGDSAPWFTHAADLDLGGPCDALTPLVLGNATYLLAYTASDGMFQFFPLPADLQPRTPYTFFHSRPPAITKGFSTVQPVAVGAGMYVLGYSFDTGAVAMYSLAVTPTSFAGTPDQPPLLATAVWDHQWAKDWTRFAFFQMGGETFFLKTNVGKLNVNIDHVLDDPSAGTAEVGTYLHLDNALDIDLVSAFALDGGQPYFLTYMADGTTTWERIHPDCQGWTREAALTTVRGAAHAVPYQAGGDTFVLFA